MNVCACECEFVSLVQYKFPPATIFRPKQLKRIGNLRPITMHVYCMIKTSEETISSMNKAIRIDSSEMNFEFCILYLKYSFVLRKIHWYNE